MAEPEQKKRRHGEEAEDEEKQQKEQEPEDEQDEEQEQEQAQTREKVETILRFSKDKTQTMWFGLDLEIFSRLRRGGTKVKKL